ncbi:MAG: hypothetical protein KBB86_02700 [Candidatus Pacebacteria bacterium]|nr:hypothetical protein [Candidatus Paceibacterota bacterium]
MEGKSKTILFDGKIIRKYRYCPESGERQDSKEVITKVINEVLKDIEFKYARAKCYADLFDIDNNCSSWFYEIEYWEK